MFIMSPKGAESLYVSVFLLAQWLEPSTADQEVAGSNITFKYPLYVALDKIVWGMNYG